MSSLRDIRILVAQRITASREVKLALLDVFNTLDSILDSEGFQEPDQLKFAMRQLDLAIVSEDSDDVDDLDDDLDDDDDDVEFVDLDEIEDLSDEDKDKEDEEDEDE